MTIVSWLGQLVGKLLFPKLVILTFVCIATGSLYEIQCL